MFFRLARGNDVAFLSGDVSDDGSLNCKKVSAHLLEAHFYIIFFQLIICMFRHSVCQIAEANVSLNTSWAPVVDGAHFEAVLVNSERLFDLPQASISF